MDWLDYREALGIGFSDHDKAEHFVAIILNFLEYNSDIMQERDDQNEFFEFCNTTGNVFTPNIGAGNGYSRVFRILQTNSHNLKEFLALYIAYINCLKCDHKSASIREGFIKSLCNALDQAHIPYDIKWDKDGCYIFPKGAKELDDALVSQPLAWLAEYPNAKKTYEIALHQYSEGIYIRDVADNLRKTLETFLQEFLGNVGNLESNKNNICKYLGSQGVDPGISGLFKPLIDAYKNINDRIAKHNDHVDKKMLEFLLYQTGVLIRMVITIKNAENENET